MLKRNKIIGNRESGIGNPCLTIFNLRSKSSFSDVNSKKSLENFSTYSVFTTHFEGENYGKNNPSNLFQKA